MPLCIREYVSQSDEDSYISLSDRQSSSISYFPPLHPYFDKCIRIHRNFPVSFLILTGGEFALHLSTILLPTKCKGKGRKGVGSARRTNSHFVCKSARINRIRAGLSRAQEMRGQGARTNSYWHRAFRIQGIPSITSNSSCTVN